jgi:tripartite-type tricarboxylate transporter receptor subunit TctC
MFMTIRMLAGAALFAVLAPQSLAQYPSKPIHILVGFAPGGASDVVTRVLAQGLSAQFGGHPVVVENRPGAGPSPRSGTQVIARRPRCS